MSTGSRGAPPTNVKTAPDERFRKSERLLKRADYVRVQTRGKKHGSRLLTIVTLPSAVGYRRIGITVSRKVGNSPVRNALKRRIREVYRLHKAHWPDGIDFVVIARPSASGASYDEIRRAMLKWASSFAPPAPPAAGFPTDSADETA